MLFKELINLSALRPTCIVFSKSKISCFMNLNLLLCKGYKKKNNLLSIYYVQVLFKYYIYIFKKLTW